MKHATSLKLTAPLIAVCLLVGITVSAQQGAKVEHSKTVEQGSVISFQITTDKAGNVPGSVGIDLASVEGNSPLHTSTYALGPDGKVTVSLTIGLDTKTGRWKISKVYFHANSGGLDKELTPSGDLTFEVVPHQTLILPSKAEVEIR